MVIEPVRVDDRVICDLVEAATGSMAVAVAHDLGVFECLAEGPRAAAELRAALGLSSRAEAVLMLCVAAGLLHLDADDRYELTEAAAAYLVAASPTYAGALFDLWSRDEPPFSSRHLRHAALHDLEEAHGRREWIEAMRADPERAQKFTRMMHGHSMAPALAWPQRIDLGAHETMLDIGGGSGAHAIGALMRWPNLRAILLDLPPVCAAAGEYISRYRMDDRIVTCAVDLWTDAWPHADLHFFSDVFHDWTPAECRTLASLSFARVARGGRIVIHEMLYDDDRRGPFTVAASSLAMATWCGGQQFSGPELAAILRDAGFGEVEVRPTFGYWSIVSGRKR